MKSSRIFVWLVCASVSVSSVLLATHAQAQVNIEAIRKAQDKQGITGELGGHITSRSGNIDGLVAGGSGRIQLREGRHLTFLYGTGNYARWGHKTTMAKAMTHLRYNYELANWLSFEAFFQLENNRFQKLTDRELLGTGPRFPLLHSDKFRLAYGTSAMLERETLALSPDDPSPDQTLTVRWSNYATFAWQIEERLALESTTYFQPSFANFSDYRILNEDSLSAGITNRISAKIALRIRYDSDPPLDVEPTDIQITNGFSLKF